MFSIEIINSKVSLGAVPDQSDSSDSASQQALGGISDLGMNKEFGRYCGKADLAVT